MFPGVDGVTATAAADDDVKDDGFSGAAVDILSRILFSKTSIRLRNRWHSDSAALYRNTAASNSNDEEVEGDDINIRGVAGVAKLFNVVADVVVD